MEHRSSEVNPAKLTEETDNNEILRRKTLENIHVLHLRSVRGLWALAAFLLISIGALWDFSFLPSLPDHLKKMLGPPPSTMIISGLLVAYSFAAIILILSRMMSGSVISGAFSHIAYLAVFYGFYHFSGGLGENFWAVLVAGFTILGLESYHVWVRCESLIREEQEMLRKLDKIEKKSSGS
jgi:hypothetical protein